eukprot:UN04448
MYIYNEKINYYNNLCVFFVCFSCFCFILFFNLIMLNDLVFFDF